MKRFLYFVLLGVVFAQAPDLKQLRSDHEHKLSNLNDRLEHWKNQPDTEKLKKAALAEIQKAIDAENADYQEKLKPVPAPPKKK